MTTRIAVQPPSISGDTARALQAANRQRLEQREEDQRVAAEAMRRINQRATRTNANRDRAVPDVEPAEPVFAKRFGKAFQVAAAWWQYELQWDLAGQVNTAHAIIVSTGDRAHTARIELPRLQLISDLGGGGPADGDRQGLTWWSCLPAGRDRLALVFYAQAITATATPVGSLTPDPTEASFPPNPGPGDTFEYIIEDTRSVQYSNPQTQAVVKVAIVSPDGINVVDCPHGLRVLLQRIYTYLTGASVSDTYVNTGSKRTGYYMTELRPDGTYRWFEHAFKYESIPRLRSAIITTYANDNQWDRDRFVWLYLLRAYGYGRLVDRDRRTVGHEQDPGWGWTPAIYSYLKNYEGQFHVSSTDPSLEEFRANAANYKYVRERFFPDDAPPFLLTSGVQTKEATAAGIDTTADYWYLRAPDAETASAISTADFNTSTLAENGNLLRRNNGVDKQEPVFSSLLPTGFYDGLDLSADNQDGALATWTFGEEIPVIAWDWGRPLACWLQLTQLGFTASDLMLTDDEAKALAAADPATAGFKF
jgi:hypothetical protein